MKGAKMFPMVAYTALVIVGGLGVFLIARVGTSTVGSHTTTAPTHRQNQPIRVSNHTQNLQVLDVERVGERSGYPRVRVTVKNGYNKNVTAFVLSAGSYTVTIDFAPDDGLAPAAMRQESLTLSPDNQAATEEQGVTVLAVVLADGTGDGDETVISSIKEHWRGEKHQAGLVLPLLRKLVSATDDTVLAELNAAEAVISNLPTEVEGERSPGFRAGLQNAKEKALGDIKRLRFIKENFSADLLDASGNKLNKFRDEAEKTREYYKKRATLFGDGLG